MSGLKCQISGIKNIPNDDHGEDTPRRTAWRLILADDPKTIADLEAEYGMTQQETVDDFIENSCWTPSLRNFVGGKGTARARLLALRKAYFNDSAK